MMIRHSIGILATALALAAPLTCAAQVVEFDRNGNGIPDIRFGGEDQGDNFMNFDNDEDGMYDFGFLSGGEVHDDGEIYAMWIDRNGNGKKNKNEVRMLPHTLPHATFPSLMSVTSEPNGDGVDYFFEYHPGDAIAGAKEIGRDLDGDGDIERDILPAIGEGTSDTIAFIDRNNDSFFDIFVEIVDGFRVEIEFPMSLRRHLPVLQMSPLP